MRFLTSVRGQAPAVFLALAACLTLIAFAGFSAPVHKANPVSFLNDRARDITGATAVNAPDFVVPGGLTGEGQIVAIADSGLDTGRLDDIHPDLQSVPGKMPKVVMLKSWAGRDTPDDPDGHGTHMATTIAGTGAASNGEFRGVAPGASIYFQGILNSEGQPQPPDNLEDLFWPAYSAGARIHVDGWGSGADTYGNTAAQVDKFVRSNPDFLVAFGAGNSGPATSTITTEANSKNALTVGASELPRPAFVAGADDSMSPADFSSRGPAGDGRIKPELLAPATAVISARSRLVDGNMPGYPDYTRMQGTSMAAAVAGGSAALLREYFHKEMKIDSPSAALLKAALINGARSLPEGSSKDGFGIIDMAGTTIALKEGAFQIQDEWMGVAQGAGLSYKFTVTDTTAPFKATLAWTDPAAEADSPHALVNDLDLIVQTPDGRMYYGNHFLGKNSPDRINNVEQVYLPSPAPGEYTVRVVGAAVNRSVISGSSVALQDFALVWGQAPAQGVVSKVNEGYVVLEQGDSFSTSQLPLVNLIDDQIAVSDQAHLFPGALVYRTPRKVYLTVRLWRAPGAMVLRTSKGIIFTEANQDIRTGGYNLANGQEVLVNGEAGSPAELPNGVEVSATVNPFDQKIRQVKVSYNEQKGIVAAVLTEKGEKKLLLEGSKKSYPISSKAVYSFEDSYIDSQTEDLPFGTGALEELVEVLPGMPVRIEIAPSSGQVEYLAVKRQVALGTVRETVAARGEVQLENGAFFRLLTEAPIKKNKADASFNDISPGDHVALIVLPDTGEAIGLAAYSNVMYGKAIEFTGKNRTLYFLGDDGQYHSLYLTPEAVIYRWGTRTNEVSIAPGSRVRITTDPAAEEIWQLDIADTFFTKGLFSDYDAAAGAITADESTYLVSDVTRYRKNGFPVYLEDLRRGDRVTLEYTAELLTGCYVLVSVDASGSGASPPLFPSMLPLPEGLVVTGSTGAGNTVYLWGEDGASQTMAVDSSGRFSFSLPRNDQDGYNFTLVAVDCGTGNVAGRKVNLPGGLWNGGFDAAKIIAQVMGNGDAGSLDEAAMNRAQVVAAISMFLNWPKADDQPPDFKDAADIPLTCREAAAEAKLRGIFRGEPDGSFSPLKSLTRAEAAVVLAALLRDLGVQSSEPGVLSYKDAGSIPAWALQAVGEMDATGLMRGRTDGAFAPDAAVTAGEMAKIMNRLLEYMAGRQTQDRTADADQEVLQPETEAQRG